MRMVTETLQLDAGAKRALTFSEVYETNTTEAKLIKGLREAGYARCQEIDHMLRDGPEVRMTIFLFVSRGILQCVLRFCKKIDVLS